jgi:hypothetical protein
MDTGLAERAAGAAAEVGVKRGPHDSRGSVNRNGGLPRSMIRAFARTTFCISNPTNQTT